MSGFAFLLYGALCYIAFLASFVYAIGFVGNFGVPKSIDSVATGPLAQNIVVDLLLLGGFAVQHSVMARETFKRRWIRIIPPAAERSTYVLLASLALLFVFAFWQPILRPIWSVENSRSATLLTALFWVGWGIVFVSTFFINHFELFGLQQVHARFRQKSVPIVAFHTPGLYRLVRHPIYLGFIIAFWATPTMTLGHLVFAIGTLAFILAGIWFEERDLIAHFGEIYQGYQMRVRMLVPWPRRRN